MTRLEIEAQALLTSLKTDVTIPILRIFRFTKAEKAKDAGEEVLNWIWDIYTDELDREFKEMKVREIALEGKRVKQRPDYLKNEKFAKCVKRCTDELERRNSFEDMWFLLMLPSKRNLEFLKALGGYTGEDGNIPPKKEPDTSHLPDAIVDWTNRKARKFYLLFEIANEAIRRGKHRIFDTFSFEGTHMKLNYEEENRARFYGSRDGLLKNAFKPL